ncbi:MAG TPA: short-chain dehydrogenase/reductase [Solirubrobacteraceae bacterium]|nr:short-chain dehydrogenase/reductase [Solirubrobacteraceae bacterium]
MVRYDLSGRVALVTGAGQGIGLAVAECLVSRGARVALVDLNAEATERAAAGLGSDRAIGLGGDVTDRAAMGAAVQAAVERFGGLDVVVANAGIAPVPATVRVMPEAEFERVVEIDLLGVYRTVAAAMDQIVARKGQIVLVASVYAFGNGMLNSPYAVAKAGVEQLGRALRVELSIHGAGATVAYFGFVDTQLVRDAFEQIRRRSGHEPSDVLPGWMIRPITPGQAAEALVRGIERRRPRVLAPRWWAVLSTLRGILNPVMDYLSTRQTRIQASLRDAETGAAAEAASREPEAVAHVPPPS